MGYYVKKIDLLSLKFKYDFQTYHDRALDMVQKLPCYLRIAMKEFRDLDKIIADRTNIDNFVSMRKLRNLALEYLKTHCRSLSSFRDYMQELTKHEINPSYSVLQQIFEEQLEKAKSDFLSTYHRAKEEFYKDHNFMDAQKFERASNVHWDDFMEFSLILLAINNKDLKSLDLYATFYSTSHSAMVRLYDKKAFTKDVERNHYIVKLMPVWSLDPKNLIVLDVSISQYLQFQAGKFYHILYNTEYKIGPFFLEMRSGVFHDIEEGIKEFINLCQKEFSSLDKMQQFFEQDYYSHNSFINANIRALGDQRIVRQVLSKDYIGRIDPRSFTQYFSLAFRDVVQTYSEDMEKIDAFYSYSNIKIRKGFFIKL